MWIEWIIAEKDTDKEDLISEWFLCIVHLLYVSNISTKKAKTSNNPRVFGAKCKCYGPKGAISSPS